MSLWVKGRPAHEADNLIAISDPIVYKMWKPQRLTTLWASTACCRDSFTFSLIILKFHILVFWVILQCHNPVCIVSAGRTNDEFQRMWKDSHSHIKLQSRHLCGGTEVNHEKPVRITHECSISQMQA
jgi:hypothetical protein